jgi:murein DD-endopeptidase MepM/ murein hydrolase activator NlpD
MATWPVYPFHTGRTGGFGAVRRSTADGGCGGSAYPCTHYAMDLVSKTGDRRVVAPEGATVVAVASGNESRYSGYGPMIVHLLGDSGRYHLLAHLEFGTVAVTAGQRVAEGQLLAKYDPAYNHTHYEVRKEKFGTHKTNDIDPALWMAGQSVLVKLALGAFVVWGALKVMR